MLAQNGYIQKIRGKGSVVLNREKMQFPVSGLVSFKELAQTLGKETKTTVHKFGLEPPSELIQKQLRPIWMTTSGKSSGLERLTGNM